MQNLKIWIADEGGIGLDLTIYFAIFIMIGSKGMRHKWALRHDAGKAAALTHQY